MPQLIVMLVFGWAVSAPIADAQPSETRLDLYDSRGHRTGHVSIDQRPGRVDQYDTRGNRLG